MFLMGVTVLFCHMILCGGVVFIVAPLLAAEGLLGGLRGEYRNLGAFLGSACFYLKLSDQCFSICVY